MKPSTPFPGATFVFALLTINPWASCAAAQYDHLHTTVMATATEPVSRCTMPPENFIYVRNFSV